MIDLTIKDIIMETYLKKDRETHRVTEEHISQDIPHKEAPTNKEANSKDGEVEIHQDTLDIETSSQSQDTSLPQNEDRSSLQETSCKKLPIEFQEEIHEDHHDIT